MQRHDPAQLRTHPFVASIEAGLVRCGVEQDDRLLIAVSGGADSTALLIALVAAATRSRWQLSLSVGHIHHHLRREADDEAIFVESLARDLALPFSIEHIDPRQSGGNLEATARRLRYAALTRMAEHHATPTIALAHHADDQLETMLMRLIRGTSTTGLAGMRAVRKSGDHRIIRPMLGVQHRDAIDFLTKIGQPWCHDKSNDDLTRWRARLRADVLPVLEFIRPDAAIKAGQVAEQLQLEADLQSTIIRQLVRKYVHTDAEGLTLSRLESRRWPRAVLAGVIRDVSRSLGLASDQLARRTLLTIAEAVQDDSGETRQFTLSPTLILEINRESVIWRQT